MAFPNIYKFISSVRYEAIKGSLLYRQLIVSADYFLCTFDGPFKGVTKFQIGQYVEKTLKEFLDSKGLPFKWSFYHGHSHTFSIIALSFYMNCSYLWDVSESYTTGKKGIKKSSNIKMRCNGLS
jgi:hypothetical protein